MSTWVPINSIPKKNRRSTEKVTSLIDGAKTEHKKGSDVSTLNRFVLIQHFHLG